MGHSEITNNNNPSIYTTQHRDLLFPWLGWTGHVGIATTDMMSPAGMNKNADQVIEVLAHRAHIEGQEGLPI